MNLPRTFCLTLPETPERTQAAFRHLSEAGLNFEFFFGIHAERFGLKTIFPYEVDHPGSGFNMGFKPTGIWLSHFMLWTTLLYLPEDRFLILEVDAKFPEGWQDKVSKALADVPHDYDILYLGSCCCLGRPQRQIKNSIWEVRWPACTHSYIVTKKALTTLLATQRKVYAPIDLSMIFHSLPMMKVYTVLPRIIEQFDTELPP